MFNRLQTLVRDYFGFSQRESRGFLLLLFLTLLCLLIPFIYRLVADRTRVDTLAADQRKLDSLVTLMQVEEARQPRFGNSRSGNRTERDKTTAEHFGEPKKLFNFDPNTVSVSGWQQLGLPKFMAERIEKYRSKGGQFRRKEDLLRIYDFPPDLYDQLEPYISLEKSASNRPGYASRDNAGGEYPRQPNTGNAPERPAYPERPAKPVLQPFDINTADTAQLIALRGIGATLAERIVKYRDALGGFVSQEQFREIYGLDSTVVDELSKYGQIRSAPRQIPVNTATAEQLDRLPFLSRRQAQVIVSYREQHGAFTSAESLRPIRILDEKTIAKIVPYLEF